MNGDPMAWESLSEAYRSPWLVADQWRAGGGRVIGIFGHDLPREVISAAGLLPIRFSPLRLDRTGATHADAVPEGLASQLSPGPILLLGALLAGALDWVDGIAIGRDTEGHTNLFYAMRELVRIGEGGQLPPFAFCDQLRLTTRPSSRYNRIRAREFGATIAEWAGPVGSDSLAAAIGDSAVVAEHLRELDRRRVERPATISGSQALVAVAAAQILPAPRACALLAALAEQEAPPLEERMRVYVTGSGQDDAWTYETLERAGAIVVGEDHEWGDDGRDAAIPTPDPWDGLVDRYHLGRHGAARSGLWERAAATVDGARACAADAVLQIVFEHDESPPWEIPELRRALGPEIPVSTVTLRYGERDELRLLEALETTRLGGAHV